MIALASVPVSTVITVLVARKSQAHFTEQWNSTGELHAHLEEFFTGPRGGQGLRPAGGSRGESSGTSNDRLFRASASAQYVSGVVQPLMIFVSNLNYIAVAVVGALQVAAGAMTIGGVQAFIQFSRLFSQPMGQIGGMLTLMQSCLASAERVFALLDAPEIPADAADAGGTAPAAGPQGCALPRRPAVAGRDRRPGGVSNASPSATAPVRPWCRTCPLPLSPGRPWRSSGTPAPARPPW